MKKVIIGILSTSMLCCLAATTVMAASEPIIPTEGAVIFFEAALKDGVAGPNWVYNQQYTSQITYDWDSEVPPIKCVCLLVGYDSNGGQPVMAYGYLDYASTSWGFPTANQKTVVYEGIIQAYANGDLLNSPPWPLALS